MQIKSSGGRRGGAEGIFAPHWSAPLDVNDIGEDLGGVPEGEGEVTGGAIILSVIPEAA